ncbi:hypothetical protein [Dyella amyloliquefaciens]|uniref:hypothetical protein n=1 Tax=Dyella amyloliquefaciens TaxID=1770545 RepID=UPI00102E859D|nr:hypothetical protein [Dyella amyloliquefaciens]
MDWFRAYHGAPTDPKWLVVAQVAGHGVTPGHVAAIWFALLDHASRAKPRGNVGTFDFDSIAAQFQWPVDLITATYAALEQRRHIVDGVLRKWDERNPAKADATATERQQRHRAKKKASKPVGIAPTGEIPVDGDDMSRRDTRDSHASRHVTLLEEKEQSKCSFSDSSRQESNVTTPLDSQRIVRERSALIANVGEFWSRIESEGMPASLFVRTKLRGQILGWLSQGITVDQFDDAVARARRKRKADNDARPINPGYVACQIDDVLAGLADRTQGGGYEHGDELSREFARG